jgi:hypothetical protein
MATNLNPVSPDALLKIVEQVKEYYVEPPPKRQRGRPRTFSGLAFLLLAVVGVVLRTFKPQELSTLLTKDATLRQVLGFSRVPHRRTLERRLDATLPEAEAQSQALGHPLLGAVEPGPDEPHAAAIDGRLYQAQGPRWHKRDEVKSPNSCKQVRQQTRHFSGIGFQVLGLKYSPPVRLACASVASCESVVAQTH